MRKKMVINDHIDMILEDNGKTHVYIQGKQFIQCMRLVLNVLVGDAQPNMASIDDAAEKLGTIYEGRGIEPVVHEIYIDPETEFFGHCSNVQAWVEHDYDTRLLHSSIAFPFLKELAKAGDAKASRVLAAEIESRFRDGTLATRVLILKTCYDLLSPETVQKLLSTADTSLKSAYYFERGNKAIDSIDFQGAIDAYRTATDLATENAEYHATYADTLAHEAFVHGVQIPFDDIEANYAKAIELDRSNVQYHSRFAQYLHHIKLGVLQDPQARQSIIAQADAETMREIELEPDDSGVYMDRCIFLTEAKGDIDAAEKMVKKHVELGKDYWGSYLNYTGFLIRYRKDQADTIMKIAKKAVELADDDYSQFITQESLTYILVAFEGDITSAESIYMNLIKAHPIDARIYESYATFLLDVKLDFSAAEIYYKKSRDLPGSSNDMVITQIRILMLAGSDIEASGLIDTYTESRDRQRSQWQTRDEILLAACWGNYMSSQWYHENVPVDIVMRVKKGLVKLKQLLIQGVCLGKFSDYWIEYSIIAGHPEPDLLRALYRVITRIQSSETLEEFPAWQNLKIP